MCSFLLHAEGTPGGVRAPSATRQRFVRTWRRGQDWHDGCYLCCSGDDRNGNRSWREDSGTAHACLSGVPDARSQEPSLGPATADREHRARVGAQAGSDADPGRRVVAPEDARERDLKSAVALSRCSPLSRTGCTRCTLLPVNPERRGSVRHQGVGGYRAGSPARTCRSRPAAPEREIVRGGSGEASCRCVTTSASGRPGPSGRRPRRRGCTRR